MLHGQKINCQRIYYLDKQYNKYLKECTHIIDAIGFKPRILKINNAKHKYCPYTGIISDRIFSLGIGYPEKITSPLGYNEYNIGLKKFSDYLDHVFPLWISS